MDVRPHMTDILLDTCIIIDVLRKKPSAINFIKELKSEPFISVLCIAELYQGARNAYETSEIDATVQSMLPIEVTPAIARLGGLYSHKFTKSHNIGLIDALIGATAELESLTLVTLNQKHFPFVKNLIVPY